MSTLGTFEQGAALLTEAAIDVQEGRFKDALAKLGQVEQLLVGSLPVDDLKDYLTDRDRRFADLAVDVAEAVKVDGDS